MKPYNMNIITATSGREALDILSEKNVDLVFMDHMMPEMDGVEVTRIIRGMDDRYYKELPIVALTANAVSGVREMFLNSGFNDFVAKPIEISALERALKNWLPQEKIKDETKSEANNQKKKDENMESNINVSKGLMYVGGIKEGYYEILQMFVNGGENNQNQLNELVEKEDWKTYVIKVHALKSTSLTVGAEKLSEFAKKLEFAGKEENYEMIKSQNAALMELYSAVITEGKMLLKKYGSN